jgi:hypothetical protein
MPSDQAPKIETAQAPDWELPEIKDVKIQSAQFKPRAPQHFDHPLAAVNDAVEIVVSLAAPVPIRAMSPVLWVGKQPLTESEVADKSGKKMRFWSFEPDKLQSGAPIRMLWMNEQPTITQKAAKFTYKQPKKKP